VFRSLPGSQERIYNTGDLAYQKDGKLFCCGRLDHQIKLRGYRIEADEISAVLKRHPLVGDCTVDLRCNAQSCSSSHAAAAVSLRLTLLGCGRLGMTHTRRADANPTPCMCRATESDPDDKYLVAYVATRSPDEVKRIFSTSDVSTLTENRFSSICRGSMARISSIMNESQGAADGTDAGNLDADLEV
jgi:acyl-CoA synthetase (AMP-forming)/AMP-acid ligase II